MGSVIELFREGGIAMFLIAGASFAAWALAIHSWQSARFLLSDLESARDIIRSVIQMGKINAKEIAKQRRSPLASMIAAEIFGDVNSHVKNQDEKRVIIEAEFTKLQESLSFLGTLAAILPLLGLLGTVLGMLVTFGVIQSHGTGEPALLANGIRQALLTTQAGLWAALPVLFFHHIVSGRAGMIKSQTDFVFGELETIIKQDGSSKSQDKI